MSIHHLSAGSVPPGNYAVYWGGISHLDDLSRQIALVTVQGTEVIVARAIFCIDLIFNHPNKFAIPLLYMIDNIVLHVTL